MSKTYIIDLTVENDSLDINLEDGLNSGGSGGGVSDVRVNGRSVVLSGVAKLRVPTKPSDIGAATSAQGSKADQSVQFTSQTLTDAQTAQARANIGAGTGNGTGTGDGSGEAPLDGKQYVRQSGGWSEMELPPSGVTDYNDLTNKPALANVATSGNYSDLQGKPTIPEVPTKLSELTNDSGFQTQEQLSAQMTTHNNSSVAHSDIRSEYYPKAMVDAMIQEARISHNLTDEQLAGLNVNLTPITTQLSEINPYPLRGKKMLVLGDSLSSAQGGSMESPAVGS